MSGDENHGDGGTDDTPPDERSPLQRQFDDQLEQFERWAEQHRDQDQTRENTERGAQP